VLEVLYFDGESARAHPAQLAWSDGMLSIAWSGGERRVHPSDVQWPERQRHGARIAHLLPRAGGGSLQCDDGAAWDTFVRERPGGGARESWVVRAQQSWRGVLAAVLLLVGVAFVGYRWGVPALSRGVVAALPPSADKAVGDLAFDSVQARWLKPSALPAERRARIEAGFARLVEAAFPEPANRPAYALRFHAGKIGPNAFALPGGTIVLTDELVTLMGGRDDVVLGVLAHELAHVRQRHGMRLVVQVSLLGAATSIALGDFSSVLAAAPALVGQLAYSRDAEREADAEAVRLMRSAGIRPDVMVEFFERVQRWRESDAGRKLGADIDLGIAFSSHPADEERVAFFRAASR
jgi:Zn-dependent protease with chaperone function